MKIPLGTEMTGVSLEWLIRILYHGYRGYSFSLKGMGSQENTLQEVRTM